MLQKTEGNFDDSNDASDQEEIYPATPSTLNSNFKASLAAFAFTPSSQKSPAHPIPKRSISSGLLKRRTLEPSDVNEAQSDVAESATSTGSTEPVRSPKKKKRVRGYADPETYAHLQGLPDVLIEDLDVVFCGINPGEKSAEIGHHYGHHSNHFWDCLHQSGFTPIKLSPEEDHTLPERFSIGLTNLVERPTIEQNELSPNEQAERVPALLEKITRYRPRILCFLGLGIAQIFQRQLEFFMEAKMRTSGVGLQNYKMIHKGGPDSASKITETLFYALPSPSARVVKPQVGCFQLRAVGVTSDKNTFAENRQDCAVLKPERDSSPSQKKRVKDN